MYYVTVDSISNVTDLMQIVFNWKPKENTAM